MPYGQVIIGPPGSGKSTYCYGLWQFFNALERPIITVNLDPAVPKTSYPVDINVTDLISLEDAMAADNLGPNGAMLKCMEYLESQTDWLDEQLELVMKRKKIDRRSAYVVFDTPGQVELSTNHDSLRRVLDHFVKKDWRLAATHLIDAIHITDASKYISMLLLSLRTMMQMELPHINVLSKMDTLRNAELPLNLDYYTEVQDLSHLLPLLQADRRTKRFAQLNEVICEIVEDSGLVSFETLYVEDKDSMMHLVAVVDQAIGYIAPTKAQSDYDGHSHDPEEAHRHHHAQQKQNYTLPLSRAMHISDVQEKWIDYATEYEKHDKSLWEKEGQLAIDRANQESLKRAGADLSVMESLQKKQGRTAD